MLNGDAGEAFVEAGCDLVECIGVFVRLQFIQCGADGVATVTGTNEGIGGGDHAAVVRRLGQLRVAFWSHLQGAVAFPGKEAAAEAGWHDDFIKGTAHFFSLDEAELRAVPELVA